MNQEINSRYIKIVYDIQGIVKNIYKNSSRKDLIMLYDVSEKRIYSYIYHEFFDTLNLKSQDMLKRQYSEATSEGKLVLFIRDEKNKVLKSYVI